MRKKAQIGTLQTIIITLVVVGIVLGIGFLLLEEFKGTIDEESATVSNESATLADCVSMTKNLTTAGLDCFNTFSVVRVTNKTSGVLVSSGNYTVNSNNGSICSTGAIYDGQIVNVTYTYKYGLDSCGGIVSTIEATKKVPAWLPIIVILVIVGILLAIVFGVIGRGAGGGFAFGRGAGTTAEI